MSTIAHRLTIKFNEEHAKQHELFDELHRRSIGGYVPSKLKKRVIAQNRRVRRLRF